MVRHASQAVERLGQLGSHNGSGVLRRTWRRPFARSYRGNHAARRSRPPSRECGRGAWVTESRRISWFINSQVARSCGPPAGCPPVWAIAMWFNVSCLVRGHEDRIRHAVRRMYLECAKCGRETPGWDLSRRAVRSSAPPRHRRRLDQRVEEAVITHHRWPVAARIDVPSFVSSRRRREPHTVRQQPVGGI